jgi:hypothetical protein
MPPAAGQDPLVAVNQALHARWLDVPLAILAVLFQAWVLGLVALALYSWLERDVASVAKAFLPLAAALAAGAVAVLALGHAWAVPHPVGGESGSGVLSPALPPGGAAVHAATFAAYTLRRYGRRGLFAVTLPLLAAASRIAAGPDWAYDLALGSALGAGLGLGAGLASARLALRLP